MFVDYEKAFDNIKHNEMFTALTECRIASDTLQYINRNATANVRVREATENF